MTNGKVFTARWLAGVALAALAAVSAAHAETGHYRILMVSKQAGNAYFAAAEAGASKAAQELGDTVIFNSPANATASEQAQIINSAIAQHVNGIILSAIDPNAVVPDMQRALKQGIKAVTYDADINKSGRLAMAMQATSEGIGETLAQVMCDVVPNCSGPIAIESSEPDSPNLSVWVHWINVELSKPKYKNLHVVETAYAGETDSGAYTTAQAILKAHPDLVGLIVPGSVQVAAAARAFDDEHVAGKVQLTGLGLPSELKSYVANGTVQKFVIWSPYDLGYMAVYMEHDLINGSLKPEPGASFDAGALGPRKIGPDNVVLLGPPLIVDKSNIGSLNF